MKICFLSCFGDLMRRDTGPSTRIYYLAKSLTNLSNEIHIVIPGQKGTLKWSDDLWVHRVNGLFPSRVLIALSRLVGVLRPTSLYFYDVSFITRTLRVILRCHAVQLEQPWTGGLLFPILARILKKPLIVDSHDVLQPLKAKRTWIRKTLEVFVERAAYLSADVILTVSENERDLLLRYGVPRKKLKVIPNGVDTRFFAPDHRKDHAAKESLGFTVVFVGNMEYWPNQEACELIKTQIAPKVMKRIDEVTFIIVGRGSPHASSLSSRVIHTGPVKDVRDYLSSSEIAIAPLFHGSGTRLKILEYFSCALPVVSTTVGAEGLDVKNGVDVLIADDMEEFADRIVELLRNKDLRQRLGNTARELVVAKYDWGEIGKKLNNVYVRCLNEASCEFAE